MDNGKGYYISGFALGDERVSIELVYGEPSTGRIAFASPVQSIERTFVVSRAYDSPRTISVSVVPVNNKSVNPDKPTVSSTFTNGPNLQRLFDYYLLQWLSQQPRYSLSNGIRFGIERVLGGGKILGPGEIEQVKNFLNPEEPLHIELPKVKVEGLEGVLEQVAASSSPLVNA